VRSQRSGLCSDRLFPKSESTLSRIELHLGHGSVGRLAMMSSRSLQAEVIAVGSELLRGQVVDTNSAHIAKVLADTGMHLSYGTAVGDDLNRMIEVLETGLRRSDVIITSGGLGPTEDDLTREAVAAATGRTLVFREELMEDIEAFFRSRGLRMAANNRKQACIPEGALPMRNAVGTAPGFVVEDRRRVIICLPGVPRELEYLLASAVLPYLRKRFRLGRQVVFTRVLRVSGLGESGVDREIGDLIRENENPAIGLLADPGDIRICLVCRARSRAEALRRIDPLEREIRHRLGLLIYGVDDETLDQKVVQYLTRLRLRVSVADTFTGGLICRKILGSGSHRLVQGFILPSRESQVSFLGLSRRHFSALSKQVDAYSMALARGLLDHADIGLAIAGDFKVSRGRLTGTLAVSVAERTGEQSRSWTLGGPREGTTERASIMALDLLRRYLLERITEAQ
jgi:nicotinamide-nucleotide amidase